MIQLVCSKGGEDVKFSIKLFKIKITLQVQWLKRTRKVKTTRNWV